MIHGPYSVNYLKVVGLILAQFWFISSPHSTALYMIVYSFICHIHYDMFRPMIAGSHRRVVLQLCKREDLRHGKN